VLERLQDYTDAAGDAERMNRISTGFEQAIISIKQWLTKFGLKDAKSGDCVVQLDMTVSLESEERAKTISETGKDSIIAEDEDEAAVETDAPKNLWGEKQNIFNRVLGKVDRVMLFRQREYSALRD